MQCTLFSFFFADNLSLNFHCMCMCLIVCGACVCAFVGLVYPFGNVRPEVGTVVRTVAGTEVW